MQKKNLSTGTKKLKQSQLKNKKWKPILVQEPLKGKTETSPASQINSEINKAQKHINEEMPTEPRPNAMKKLKL